MNRNRTTAHLIERLALVAVAVLILILIVVPTLGEIADVFDSIESTLP